MHAHVCSQCSRTQDTNPVLTLQLVTLHIVVTHAVERVIRNVQSMSRYLLVGNIRVFLEKWIKEQPCFHKYFIKQWLKSTFNNWQLFHTPPGFTQTNSPIESYNKVIKKHFTEKIFFNFQQFINYVKIFLNTASECYSL